MSVSRLNLVFTSDFSISLTFGNSKILSLFLVSGISSTNNKLTINLTFYIWYDFFNIGSFNTKEINQY